jgi:soluble lytic murein transglycosylase-like protein
MVRYGAQAILLGVTVTVTITTAAPAGAQTYRLAALDGTIHLTNTPTSPAYRGMGVTGATDPGSWGNQQAYSREIAEAAARYGVPERLVWAVIRAESGFDARAVSRKGARGLMQLMPETAAILGVRDSFNPRENIDAGVRHLRALLERFRNNLRFAIAAYNAGEKAVASYGGIPPYPETQEYVTRVLRFYGSNTPIESTSSPSIEPARVVWFELPGGMYQIVKEDGTVVYTNISPANWPRPPGG